ncbi:MAG: Threonylcarbamoyl adenosine biosynthesis protein TsaE [Candidatus Parcubacteria bacterium]
MRRMPIPRGPFRNLFHFDAYRLSTRADIRILGIHDIVKKPDNVLAVEWPEVVRGLLPRGAHYIRFAHGRRANERRITIPKILL